MAFPTPTNTRVTFSFVASGSASYSGSPGLPLGGSTAISSSGSGYFAPNAASYSAAYRSAIRRTTKTRLDAISRASSKGASACIQRVSARPSQNCQRA